MKIRNNTRIVALVLALVMLLPLISIPAFAEEVAAAVDFAENFDTAESVADVKGSKMPTSATLSDGALRIEHAAFDSGKYYAMANQNTAYEIANAVVDGSTVSGQITISSVTYNVSGEFSDTKTKAAAATVTKVEDDSAYATELYIFTGKVCDAWQGGWNVAVATTVKNPEVLPETATKITVSADYFFSTDVNSGKEYEVTIGGKVRGATNANGRVDIAKIGTDSAFVYLNWHADAKTQQEGAVILRAPKGQWFNVRADLDLTTGNIALFLNNEYAMTVTDTDLPGGVTANSLNVFQISRGTTPNDPDDMKGYVLVDNVKMTSENDVYYANDFDQYAGMSRSDLEGGTYQNNFGTTTPLPSRLEVVTEEGDAYLKYNFGADITPGSDFDTEYFAYANYTRFAYNGKITSYENGILTVEGGTTFEVTAASAANIAAGYYGDFTYNDTKYMLTSGAYAAENKFGDNNVDKAIALRIPPMTSADHSEIYISMQVYIEPGSKGQSTMQFYQTVAKTYLDLGNINLATGQVGGKAVYLPIGEWAHLGIKIDLASGATTYYVYTADGFLTTASYGDIGDNLQLHPSGKAYTTSELIIAKHNKGAGAGSISYDDVMVSNTSYIPVGKGIAKLDFENQTVGSAPSAGLSVANSGTIVDNTKGSKAWKIQWNNVGGTGGSDSGDLNIDKNSYFSHAALNYTDHPIVVFSADYFIEGGATGRIQSQLNGVSVNGAAAISWSDLYQLQGNSGTWVLAREGGTTHGTKALDTNTWNNVAAELNLATGKLNVYLNGELVIDSWLNMGDSASRTNLTAAANKWVVGKVNKILGSGTFYMDNLKMTIGAFEAVETPDVQQELETFDAFKYADGLWAKGSIVAAPALATYKVVDGNAVLRLGMGAGASESTYALYSQSADKKYDNISYTPGATEVTYGGTNYTIAVDEANGLSYVNMTVGDKEHKFYIISSAAAEAAYGGANVGSALQIFANTLSYENATTAILEEDLFIEAGSTGILESQFTGYKYQDGGDTSGGWLQLFHLYMENGLITGQGGENYGVKLNLGEWNNVKIVVDLVEGVFSVYANGVLARTYDCGKDNIIIESSWIPVKVQRHNNAAKGAYEGGILVDNVRVSTNGVPTSNSQYGANFLTDAAFEAYVADIVTAVTGASIRLTDPTGLRFASLVDTAKLNYLLTHAGATGDMGTLITPESYLNAAGAFTKEALDTVNVNNAKYLDVKFDGDFFDGCKGFDASEGSYMVGSIVNILEKNITRKFAGAGYVTITINEVTYTVYAEAQIRSVQEVAAAALADQNAGWSTAEIAILEGFAN